MEDSAVDLARSVLKVAVGVDWDLDRQDLARRLAEKVLLEYGPPTALVEDLCPYCGGDSTGQTGLTNNGVHVCLPINLR